MDKVDPWFDELFCRYAKSMVWTAFGLLHDTAVAEELVQDVFVSLLLHRDRVVTYERPGNWLFSVMRGRVRNELKRAKYKREIPLGPEHESYPSIELECDNLADNLPKGLRGWERQFLIWYFQDELSHEEIAARMNISVHASEARLYRLRIKCYKLFSKNKNRKRVAK